MTDDRRRRAEELFLKTVELPVAQRFPFLFEQCGEDVDLFGLVANLLDSDNKDKGKFLSVPLVPTSMTPKVGSSLDSEGPTITSVEADGDVSADRDSGDSSHEPGYSGGERFFGLEVLEEIAPGSGGMGKVFRAREMSLDRVVAVKTVQTYLKTAKGRDLFEREARAIAKLEHPNIVKIFSFNPQHDPPYIVMQFVDGEPMDQMCKGSDFRQISMLLEQVARALAYAHDHDVVHGDVKPNNVLVDHEGHAFLMDFGLTSPIDPKTANDGKARIGGTPQYIAPEIYTGTGGNDPATDIYALGVTMYRLLTGRNPFRSGSYGEVRQKVLEARPPLPRAVNSDIPEPLQRICLTAMEADSSRRYQSAQRFAEDLKRFIEGREVLVRPQRYNEELQGKLQNHIVEIQGWHEQNLINVHFMDWLARPYRAMLEFDSPWRVLSRSFPWEAAVLRLGSWLVVLSSVLWPIYYWGELSHSERVLAIGFPTFALNISGILFHSVKSRWNAQIFLAFGSLLVPLFVVVLFIENQWFQFAQGENYELFWSAPSLDLSGSDRQLKPTNAQMTLSFAVQITYCIFLHRLIHARIFLVSLGIGLYLFVFSALLLMGLRERISDYELATSILCYMILPLWCWLQAMIWVRGRRHKDAATIYMFFPVPLVVFVTMLAIFASYQWFDSPWEFDDITINNWLILNGIGYFAASQLSSRAKCSFVRFWNTFLMTLVPISLLVPTHLLFEKGWILGELGGQELHAYSLLNGFFAVSLVFLGTKLSRATLAIPGLVGMATFIIRITERHFGEHTAWPFVLVIIGGLAMSASVGSYVIRAKLRRQDRHPNARWAGIQIEETNGHSSHKSKGSGSRSSGTREISRRAKELSALAKGTDLSGRCPNCSKETDANETVCSNCGRSL